MTTEHYVGVERRKDAGRAELSVSKRLNDLHTRIALLEETVTGFKDMQEDVHAIKELLMQTRGALTLIKTLFYVVGPIVLAGYWIKEHLR